MGYGYISNSTSFQENRKSARKQPKHQPKKDLVWWIENYRLQNHSAIFLHSMQMFCSISSMADCKPNQTLSLNETANKLSKCKP